MLENDVGIFEELYWILLDCSRDKKTGYIYPYVWAHPIDIDVNVFSKDGHLAIVRQCTCCGLSGSNDVALSYNGNDSWLSGKPTFNCRNVTGQTNDRPHKKTGQQGGMMDAIAGKAVKTA